MQGPPLAFQVGKEAGGSQGQGLCGPGTFALWTGHTALSRAGQAQCDL